MHLQTVYTHMNLDNSQSELSNLIGQLQVHYFTYEPLRSTYEPGIMWSDSIGQLDVHIFLHMNRILRTGLLLMFYRGRSV